MVLARFSAVLDAVDEWQELQPLFCSNGRDYIAATLLQELQWLVCDNGRDSTTDP
jgi:hypothetical protein